MTIAFVTNQKATADSGANSGTTISVTFPGNTTTGNLVIVGSDIEDTGSASVTKVADSQGNTYEINQVTVRNSTTQQRIAGHFCPLIIGGTTPQVEVTFAASGTWRAIHLSEYSHAKKGILLDKTASATGSSNDPQSGSQTPTTDGQLIWGMVDMGSFSAADSPFTLLTGPGGAGHHADEYYVQSTAASITADFSLSGTESWGCIMMTLREGAGPAFVAKYETAWDGMPASITVMNAVSVNAGDVIVHIGSRATTDGTDYISFTENGAASFTALENLYDNSTCQGKAVGYVVPSNETLTTTVVDNTQTVDYGAIAVRFSASDGIGASEIAVDTSGDNTISITTTQDNSAVLVALFDWNATDSAHTWNAPVPLGQLTRVFDSGQYTIYVALYPDVGTAGAKTVGLTAPDSNNVTIVAVEIKNTPTGTYQYSDPNATLYNSDGWTKIGGGTTDMHLTIDEGATPNDSDGIESAESPSNDAVVFGMSDLTGGTPDSARGSLRYKKSAAGGDTLSLVAQWRKGYTNEGSPGTLVATLLNNTNIGDTITQVDYNLTSGERSAIDMSDIVLRLVANKESSPGIVYVGSQKGGFAGKTGTTTVTFSLTGGTNSTPQAGDFVIVSYCVGSTADRALTIRNASSTDYTLIGSELYQNDTYDVNLRCAYRFMPSPTPETTMVLSGTGNIADAGSYTIHVFRNVDTGTPLDVTAVTAGGVDTRLANPGSITPTTAGAIIYVVGAAACQTAGAYTASYLSGFQAQNNADTNDSMIGAGYVTWTSGAYDPAAFTGGGTGTTNDSWAALTVALRPASTARKAQVTWARFRAPEATSGTPMTLTSTLNAAIQAAFSSTATMSTAVQGSPTPLTATLNAGIADPKALTATVDLAVANAQSATATLNAALQAAVTSAATLDAGIQAGQSATSTLSAAVVLARQAQAALDAAVQSPGSATVELTAAIQAARSAAATLEAAIQASGASTATADAAIAASRNVVTALDAAIQAARSGTSTVDAAIQAQVAATATLDLAVQVGRSASASLDANIEEGATTITSTTTLDAAIQIARNTTATLDGAIQAAQTASATLEAAIQQVNTAQSTMSAAVQAPASVSGALDGAIQAAKTAAATLDTYVLSGGQALANLDAAISAASAASASLDGAIQVSNAATVTADAAIESARWTTMSADSVIQAARDVAASLDLAVQGQASIFSTLDANIISPWATTAAMDAAILWTGSATAFMDVYIAVLGELHGGGGRRRYRKGASEEEVRKAWELLELRREPFQEIPKPEPQPERVREGRKKAPARTPGAKAARSGTALPDRQAPAAPATPAATPDVEQAWGGGMSTITLTAFMLAEAMTDDDD